MANSTTAFNPELWQSTVQDYLVNMLVAKEVAMTKFEVGLEYGSSVDFPDIADFSVQTYTPGTDLNEQAITGGNSVLTIGTSKGVLLRVDDIEKRQAKADFQITLSKHMAYLLANQIDQAVLSTGVTNASVNKVYSSSIDAGTMFQVMLDADTQLFRNNAYSNGSEKFAVMGPQFKNLLAATFVANGFVLADSTLHNGYEGMANGFNVYTSNNLPSSQTLTLAATPTTGDSITIMGVTVTFVTSATNPGEVTISGTTHTNFLNLIANTSTGFVDVSQENRAIWTNAGLAASAFATNVTTLTGAGFINGTVVLFTSGSNLFGTETTSILFGVKGNIALATQIEPTLETSRVPKQFGTYLKGMDLYGTTVFTRSKKRLYVATVNA